MNRPTNIHDVAAFVLSYFEKPISTMKLQKLCFFGQGWTLGLSGSELFSEDFEAWRNGPVNWDLYDLHRGAYNLSEWPQGNPNNLDERRELILDAVLQNFGALSGPELSDLTHRPGTPWALARQEAGAGAGAWDNTLITKESIKEYFQAQLA